MTENKPSGKPDSKPVAFIVGAGGIGKALAEAFNAHGFRVVLGLHERSVDVNDTLIIRLDVRNETLVKQAIDIVHAHTRRIDVLVNASGIYSDAVTWKMLAEQWDNVLDVNLKGTFLLTKHVIPVMREQGYGRILHISSIAAEKGIFGTVNYAASKAGVLGFVRAAAKEVARFGITINALVLGYADAGMYHRLPVDVRAKLEADIPVGRPATLAEVAAPVLFLTSPGASYITGQAVHVNGGYFP